MRAILTGKRGLPANSTFRIGKNARIGKDTENHIALDFESISRTHAYIHFNEQISSYILQDLGSEGGTFLNGVQVFDQVRVQNGDTIELGAFLEFQFNLLNIMEDQAMSIPFQNSFNQKNTNPEAAHSNWHDGVKTALQFQPGDSYFETATEGSKFEQTDQITHPYLTMADSMATSITKWESSAQFNVQTPSYLQSSINEPAVEAVEEAVSVEQVEAEPAIYEDESTFLLTLKPSNETYPLKDGENVIGRKNSCDVTINHNTVSKLHACIAVENETLTVTDLKSKNHTFIDNKRIIKLTKVEPNMDVKFGEVEATISLRQEDSILLL